MNSFVTKTGRTLLLVMIAGSVFAQSAFQVETQKWRQKREAALKAEEGWLTVAGLFWLKEGPNTFGTGKRNIVLPKGRRRRVLVRSNSRTEWWCSKSIQASV